MASLTSLSQPSSYGPSNTALLLLDLHGSFVGMITDDAAKDKLIKSVQALLAAARESKTPILHCLVDANRDPLPTSKLAGRWEESVKPAFQSDPASALQLAELAGDRTSKSEYFFNRLAGRVSALKSEGIMELLKEKLGVRNLVLGGLVSSGCVLSTARGAADEGFVVSVVPEACWDRDVSVHNTVMEKIVPMTGHSVGLDEAVGLLRGSVSSK